MSHCLAPLSLQRQSLSKLMAGYANLLRSVESA